MRRVRRRAGPRIQRQGQHPAPTGARKRRARPRRRGLEKPRGGGRNLGLIGNILTNLIVFVGLALGGGLGTAWYMIEGGSRLSTRTFGPWTTWVAAGRPDADPYTRAHTARNGLLPLASTL